MSAAKRKAVMAPKPESLGPDSNTILEIGLDVTRTLLAGIHQLVTFAGSAQTEH